LAGGLDWPRACEDDRGPAAALRHHTAEDERARRIRRRASASLDTTYCFGSQTATDHVLDIVVTPQRQHYDRRRQTHGDRHAAALRNLFNRFLGCLYQCLTTRQTYNEANGLSQSNRGFRLTSREDRRS
jgi:hypothetical protein